MKEIVLLIITLALLIPLVSIGDPIVTDSTICLSHERYASMMYDLDNCDTIKAHTDTVYKEVIKTDSIQTVIEYKIDKACEIEKKEIKERSFVKSVIISGLLFTIILSVFNL